MVLVMRSDGSLDAQSPQSGFSRTYGDARRSDRDSIFLFNEEEEEEGTEEAEAAAIVPRAVVPPAAVLQAIDETAMRYGSHPALRGVGFSVTDWRRLFRANIEIESAYNPNARSHVGAIGLGQLMPATASTLGVDPHDWRENLDGSARYLLMMLARFQDPRLALAAYNAGPNAVVQNGGIPPYQETQNHVLKVMGVYARLQGDLG
ncbi:MAG: lytic transglycosylase domain-containing protein [Alteromonadaceae bacterium]|nr:lytic transglycosylase domain-containing protein [Alteromonadaceae bacterium]